jgi:hypothetical protein
LKLRLQMSGFLAWLTPRWKENYLPHACMHTCVSNDHYEHLNQSEHDSNYIHRAGSKHNWKQEMQPQLSMCSQKRQQPSPCTRQLCTRRYLFWSHYVLLSLLAFGLRVVLDACVPCTCFASWHHGIPDIIVFALRVLVDCNSSAHTNIHQYYIVYWPRVKSTRAILMQEAKNLLACQNRTVRTCTAGQLKMVANHC